MSWPQLKSLLRYPPLLQDEYPYIVISDTIPVVSDSLFYLRSRGVLFKVNTLKILPGEHFADNFRELLPKLWGHGMQIKGAYIRGAASPEGAYYNNVWLGRNRALTLARMLSAIADSMGVVVPIDTTVSVAEDYGFLLELMRRANDSDYERVAAICRQYRGDDEECKAQLMKEDYGWLWKRILDTYYPRLRRAGVILWAGRDQLLTDRIVPVDVTGTFPDVDISYRPDIAPISIPIVRKLPHKRMLALRTNLIQDLLYLPNFHWAAMMPNLQAEYFPLYGHYTYNAGFSFSNYRRWRVHKFFQVRDVRAGVRRYFRGGGTFEGPFLGAYGEFAVYGIGYNAYKGWEGEGGGAGLTVGHTMRLNRKGSLRLELTADVGVFFSKQDPYVWGNPKTGYIDGLYYYRYTGRKADFRKRDHSFMWAGPTCVGIQVTYDILYHKRGAGFSKGGAQ